MEESGRQEGSRKTRCFFNLRSFFLLHRRALIASPFCSPRHKYSFELLAMLCSSSLNHHYIDTGLDLRKPPLLNDLFIPLVPYSRNFSSLVRTTLYFRRSERFLVQPVELLEPSRPF
jgi:hypothetical protein